MTRAAGIIYFKHSWNDTVEGFDCVHVLGADDGLELWLGEVKLYTDAADAGPAVVAELFTRTHVSYLRGEFAAIWRKLDAESPHRGALRPLLGQEMLDCTQDARTLGRGYMTSASARPRFKPRAESS